MYIMSFNQKVSEVKEWFSSCNSCDQLYRKIIELGRSKRAMDEAMKIPSNLVEGCQSRMYLYSFFNDGSVHFVCEADALISSGLGVLLTHVYSGEKAEDILKNPPAYLEELGIINSLSPNRANGLYSLHLRMKQEALKFIVAHSQSTL